MTDAYTSFEIPVGSPQILFIYIDNPIWLLANFVFSFQKLTCLGTRVSNAETDLKGTCTPIYGLNLKSAKKLLVHHAEKFAFRALAIAFAGYCSCCTGRMKKLFCIR